MRISKFVGLDVHKLTTSVAIADASGGEPRYLGVIPSDDAAIRKLIQQLGNPKSLCLAYEAGPTGYGLHRLLKGLGCQVMVVAPSLIPRKAGDRKGKGVTKGSGYFYSRFAGCVRRGALSLC